MTRIAAIIGIVAAVVVGFVLLGNSRSAEGPPAGGQGSGAGGRGAPLTAQGSGHNAQRSPSGPMAVPVEAAAALRRDMRQVLKVDGSLKTDDEVQIGTRLPGKV